MIGGSACPRAVIEAFQDDYGVRVLHAWGMTETSPLGHLLRPSSPRSRRATAEGRLAAQETVGHPPFTVDLTITDDAGDRAPAALGRRSTQGRLQIRGPGGGAAAIWARPRTPSIDADGWFDTGDAATIDANGYVRITDRFKDVIKSGGEWISSIDLENAAVAHPDVAEAAAVACIIRNGTNARCSWSCAIRARSQAPEAILAQLAPHFAKWQLPDDVLFVDEIPHTATGKISKLTLREAARGERLSTARIPVTCRASRAWSRERP